MNRRTNSDRLVNTSRIVVRIALIANRVFLVLLAVGLALTFIFSRQFAPLLLGFSPPNLESAKAGMRLLIVIGILGSAATDRILVALTQIIATVSAGDPFIGANALRLRTIGWFLLGLQLLDIAGALLGKFFPSMGAAAPSNTISIVGWISVLMVFVLSRVFAAGSAMRDELEGTV
jgi:hypothetical protein